MDRQKMDQQVEQILEQARRHIVEQVSCHQAGMRWHTDGLKTLLRVHCSLKDGRYWRHFGHWPEDLAAWQARRRAA